MSTYNPDSWVVLKFTHDGQTTYKVLAGFGGSYLYGSSWKLNSGVTNVEVDGDYLLFSGYSGSVYRCHKNSYCMRGVMHAVYSSFVDQVKENPSYTMELMDEATDFTSIDYKD
jgi:hypothetical protein